MIKKCAYCKNRFRVRVRKSKTKYPNVHRKYCLNCDAVKIWSRRNHKRHEYLKSRWMKENPEKAKSRYRRHRLMTKYGLTVSEFDELVKEQKNKCAICFQKFNGRWNKPNIDHKHGGKRRTHRGLLCVNCNLLVGFSKENETTLKSAIRYLIKWES